MMKAVSSIAVCIMLTEARFLEKHLIFFYHTEKYSDPQKRAAPLDTATILTFMLATALMVAIPGPSIMMIVGAGIAGGRRAALGVVFAIAAADLVLIGLVASGLGALAEAGGAIEDGLTIISGLVLVALGMLAFRARRTEHAPQLSVRAYSLGSFLVTMANPKSLLFFAAFLPQFVDASRPAMPQYLTLTVLFILAGMPVALAYAFGASFLSDRDGALRYLRVYGPRLAGLVLIALGAASLVRFSF
jgi:threonine/homoserine/homoserine lactone efflux protein